MSEEESPQHMFWELMYSVYEKQLVDKSNIIVLFCHYVLVRRGMKNAGLGEDVSLPNQKDTNELLPEGWNDSLPCRMRYYYDKKLYLLTIHPADDDEVIINLRRPCDDKISVSVLSLNEIAQVQGRLEEILPNWSTILDRINNELINPLLKNAACKDVQCQTAPPRQSSLYIPDGVPNTIVPPIVSVPPGRGMIPRPPLGVGSSDLDPLGGGGGMIFQPPGMGPSFVPDPLLPRGAVPPGARFDPIFPGRGPGRIPRPGRGGFPDPDHLPPPGYDDMFS